MWRRQGAGPRSGLPEAAAACPAGCGRASAWQGVAPTRVLLPVLRGAITFRWGKSSRQEPGGSGLPGVLLGPVRPLLTAPDGVAGPDLPAGVSGEVGAAAPAGILLASWASTRRLVAGSGDLYTRSSRGG